MRSIGLGSLIGGPGVFAVYAAAHAAGRGDHSPCVGEVHPSSSDDDPPRKQATTTTTSRPAAARRFPRAGSSCWVRRLPGAGRPCPGSRPSPGSSSSPGPALNAASTALDHR